MTFEIANQRVWSMKTSFCKTIAIAHMRWGLCIRIGIARWLQPGLDVSNSVTKNWRWGSGLINSQD